MSCNQKIRHQAGIDQQGSRCSLVQGQVARANLQELQELRAVQDNEQSLAHVKIQEPDLAEAVQLFPAVILYCERGRVSSKGCRAKDNDDDPCLGDLDADHARAQALKTW